jgi:DNA-nicking Smr family endonuclease
VTKKPEPFNNPFSKVKLAGPQQAKKPAPARAAPAAPPRRAGTDDDAALFLEAVGGVEVVRAGKQKVGPPPPREQDLLAARTEEAESLARLAELVSGGGEFELADSDSLIEGAVQGLDPRVLRRLRAAEFSTQAHVDLHGLTRDQAKVALDQFLSRSRIAGHRCVLVVTGRGLNSEDQVPVLKRGVQEWLTHGRLARQVLAFTSARPKDGGAGAVYVLLRR